MSRGYDGLLLLLLLRSVENAVNVYLVAKQLLQTLRHFHCFLCSTQAPRTGDDQLLLPVFARDT